jgi:hypothetical protein
MHDSFLHALLTQRSNLIQRWEELLRAERVTSPLADPDSLVHLMNWTLDSLFSELKQPQYRRHRDRSTRGNPRQHCICGLNPLLGYFATSEQAITELLFVSEQSLAFLGPTELSSSLIDLKTALNEVARREIESFCAVCQSKAKVTPVRQCAKATTTPLKTV